MRHAALLLLTSVFLFGEFAFGSQAVAAETVCENTEKEAADSPGSLYALSAVLMDGESGRILYEKRRGNTQAQCQYHKSNDLYSGSGKRGRRRLRYGVR